METRPRIRAKLKNFIFMGFAIMSMLFVSSCSEEEGGDPQLESSEVEISTSASLGSILTDGNNITLYFFTKDSKGVSRCLDGCLDKWPLFYVEDLKVGQGLDIADFGVITHANGASQTTYKDWPLYYYAPSGDGVKELPGQTTGEAVGSVWFVAKPDYTIMLANAQLVGHDGKNYKSDYSEGSEETQYFVDAEGRTLYAFIKDYNNINNFTKEDFSNDGVWPIFFEELGGVPSSLNKDDFETISVHGRDQLTYKGWPLYYFGQDAVRGDNTGISFPAPGVWPIVNASIEVAPTAPTVKITETSTLGEVITDGQGRTLYFFTRDVSGITQCAGGCLNAWPIFHTDEIIIAAGSDLDPDDFSEITLGDGTKQTTFEGWPLYYFAPNGDGVIENPGETAGDGVNGVWYAAVENYDLMIADAQLTGHDGINYLGDYTPGDGRTKYFVDAKGRTLYIFKNDSKDTNNFTNEDFSNDPVWPIFYQELQHLPSDMNIEDFGEIEVYGKKQLTYKGWPLYYFGQDENRGENKGISFPAPGVWPIINFETMPAP